MQSGERKAVCCGMHVCLHAVRCALDMSFQLTAKGDQASCLEGSEASRAREVCAQGMRVLVQA